MRTVLVAVTFLGSMAFNQACGQTDRNTPTNLLVHVRNLAKVPDGILGPAKTTASWIFRQAGIQVLWVDCATPNAERLPSCASTVGCLVSHITIVPASMAERFHLSPEKLGVSVQPNRAFAFYNRIEGITSSTGDFYKPRVLGNVIAHELGHLLLPGEGHSQTGIMSETLIFKEIETPSVIALLFTSAQAERMRARLPRETEHLKRPCIIDQQASKSLQQTRAGAESIITFRVHNDVKSSHGIFRRLAT